MGFAMKMNLVDTIVDDSLEDYILDGKVMGYEFKIRMDYYRGHFLSVIDEFRIKVDDYEVDNERVKLCINGKEFSPAEFGLCYNEFWQIKDAATVRVFYPEDGGLPRGEHKVELIMYIRSPYMPIGPDHKYMPVDFCGTKVLSI